MSIALVVRQPFADYAKGDRITDPATVQKLLQDQHLRVIKITVSDPTPEHAPQSPPHEAEKPA